MAKHDIDPVLRQLVQAISESENATVPITVTVRGTQLSGVLPPDGLGGWRRHAAEPAGRCRQETLSYRARLAHGQGGQTPTCPQAGDRRATLIENAPG